MSGINFDISHTKKKNSVLGMWCIFIYALYCSKISILYNVFFIFNFCYIILFYFFFFLFWSSRSPISFFLRQEEKNGRGVFFLYIVNFGRISPLKQQVEEWVKKSSKQKIKFFFLKKKKNLQCKKRNNRG